MIRLEMKNYNPILTLKRLGTLDLPKGKTTLKKPSLIRVNREAAKISTLVNMNFLQMKKYITV